LVEFAIKSHLASCEFALSYKKIQYPVQELNLFLQGHSFPNGEVTVAEINEFQVKFEECGIAKIFNFAPK